MKSPHLPQWLAPGLALLGLLGVALAGLWPVHDERLLKMSCYWAMRAALPLQALVALSGIAGLLATSRDGLRTAALLGGGAAAMVLLTLHVVIPVMPHSVPWHRTPQDLLAGLTILLATAGLAACREERELDAALDALAAAADQPRS